MDLIIWPRYFNWTYASLVYTETEYGLKGYETLTEYAQSYHVCFGAQIKVSAANDSEYDQVNLLVIERRYVSLDSIAGSYSFH